MQRWKRERAKSPRYVTLCRHAPKGGKSRGPSRLWAFGARDLEKLLGMSAGAVRQAMHRGLLDPTDLESIALYWLKRRGPGPSGP